MNSRYQEGELLKVFWHSIDDMYLCTHVALDSRTLVPVWESQREIKRTVRGAEVQIRSVIDEQIKNSLSTQIISQIKSLALGD